MNRRQLVKKVAARAGISEEQALKAVVSLCGAIIESMEGGHDVRIDNLGTLRLKEKVTKVRGRELMLAVTASDALRAKLRGWKV